MTASSKTASSDILINKDMPGVFITAERSSIQQTGRAMYILKLHNNYRVPIEIPTFDFGNNQTGIVYEICSITKKTACEEYGEELVTMDIVLAGHDLVFSIPSEHVSGSSYLRSQFNCDDEASAKRGGPVPQHFAILYGSSLPNVTP